MTFSKRLKSAVIALSILILCFPLAIILTVSTSSLWSWLDRNFEIEAYGHSGPAEWCYLVSYSLFVAICIYIWSRLKDKRNQDIDSS
jgi:ABC-type spermidine/putrescine transport system permease subunit II